MAVMIPAVCPADAPPGEVELFRRLRDDPGTTEWTVLHGLDLAKHVRQVAGEADFVVVVPESGVLVIEVKSHTRIHVNEQGWHMGSDPEPKRKGPFKQASSAMHSVRAYLLDRDQSFGSIIMWSAVCFPRLEFRVKSPEWHDWQVIDRGRLVGAPVSRTIRGILAMGGEHLCEKGLRAAGDPSRHASRARCEALVAALRPKFELTMPPKVRRKEEDDKLFELTREQFVALDQMSGNPRVLFNGAAGTGKTVLAMEAMRRESLNWRSSHGALFCFNKLLGQQLGRKAAEVFPRAEVSHVDSWMAKIAASRITHDDRNSEDFFEGRLAGRAAEHLMELPEPPFDFLILDEAQDLMRPHYLDVLDLALKGGLAGGRWLMFGDFIGQDIFSRGEISVDEFVDQRCPGVARYSLTANCRTTHPISEYVVTLGQLNPPYTRVLRGDDHQDPELHFWSNSADQIGSVSDFISKCLADGFKPGDIALLSPLKKGSTGQVLAEHPDWKGQVGPWDHARARVGYATVQGFKGLESPVVVLTDFEKMDSHEQQSLFYIALSRALHRLGIFLHRDLKSFIRSIT